MYRDFFKDKIILVTGSTRGIGKEIAFSFARLGAKLIINGNEHIDQLKDTYEEIKLISPESLMIKADVSNEEEVKNMFDVIEKTFGKLDILINNAGISKINMINDIEYSEWLKLINTNLSSAYLVSKYALPYMIANKSGSIINISSMWGIHGASCETAYSASKGGLNAFTKALAKEVGPSKVRVNAVACGFIDTTMNEEFSDDEKHDFVDNHTMLEDIGTTTDVSNAVVFLASNHARYITGSIIPVDGGFY